ncbi:MAG: response regulator transcription factor [Candidatus Shapirobacteria bacterium]|nr:response regulator transcription factor [Candidatus Shapirobacteria bacterium]MDD4410144.1 response regulator transcription factor [Candidatus Shapirobacteria bacterium]
MKILVVEDEHLIANALKKGLEQEHYTVDLAFDGLEGFDLAASGDYDIVLLDLMLPKMDGLEICRQLRSQQNHVPILMLTAKSQVEDKIKGLNCGADDYLTKPFAFEELLARIRALARRPQKAASEVLTIGDLSLNLSTYEVTRQGKNISLSSKEYSLLECLLRHANKILTKDQLIQHVWSYESDILPNTIEVYIRNLRLKIDKNYKIKLIKTIRGFGYKISE